MDPVVILSSTTVSVGPGQEARLPVRVRNQSRRVESYRVEVVGAPAAFSRVDPGSVSVLPGREAEIDVWFNPPAGASTPTGSLPFAVRATSEVDESSSAAAEGLVELAGVAGLQAWFGTTARSARWKTSYDMEFANQGNAAVRLAVMAHDPSGAVNVAVSEDVIDLSPGGRTTSKVTAKARQPFLRGSPANRIIQARCQSFPFGADRPEPGAAPPLDDPNHRTFQLTFEQKPILSKLVIVLAVLVVGLLAAFVVLKLRSSDEVALGLASPEAPPTFTATPQGSTVIFLKWAEVPNAVGYQVQETDRNGEPVGEPVAAALEPTVLSHEVTVNPGERHCYAVRALGLEDRTSDLTEPQCATTPAASRLPRPRNFHVEPVGDGAFNLSWEYPADAPEGVEFRVLVDSVERADVILDSPATIVLEQRETPYTARLALLAVLGEERSDATESQNVEVEALTTPSSSVVATSEPTPTSGVVVPPPPPPPDGSTPTTAGQPSTTSEATTTDVPTTTTGPSSAAQEELQDLTGTWAALYRPEVHEPPAGVGLDAMVQNLATRLQVLPRTIRSFSNRDTIVTDADGQPWPDGTATPPEILWLYREAPDRPAATQRCADFGPGCEVVFVEGAAARADRTDNSVLVLQPLATDTPVQDLNDQLQSVRDELERSSVYLLDGAEYEGFEADQLIMYVQGTPSELLELCTAQAIECTPVELRARPD